MCVCVCVCKWKVAMVGRPEDSYLNMVQTLLCEELCPCVIVARVLYFRQSLLIVLYVLDGWGYAASYMAISQPMLSDRKTHISLYDSFRPIQDGKNPVSKYNIPSEVYVAHIMKIYRILNAKLGESFV